MAKIYALVVDGRVKEIIKSEGIFENIPIEKRYSAEKIKDMFECGEEVTEGMDYNYETGEYTEHIEEIEEVEENVEEVVENGEGTKINESEGNKEGEEIN